MMDFWLYRMSPIKEIFFLFTFLLVSSTLSAEEKSMKIQWKEVKGSRGYIVRIQNMDLPQESPEERITQDSFIEFRLEPGDYRIQVAGKNAFGKPGKFSQWKSFSIQEKQKAGTLDLSSNKPAEYDYGSDLLDRDITWKSWIPGLPQYDNKSYYTTSFYWAIIPVLSYMGYSEKRRGDAIADDIWNDPVFLYFALKDRPLQEKIYFRNRRENEKLKYNRAQNYQRGIIGGLVLVYIAHWVDLYFFNGQGFFQALEWNPNAGSALRHTPYPVARNPILSREAGKPEAIFGFQFVLGVDL